MKNNLYPPQTARENGDFKELTSTPLGGNKNGLDMAAGGADSSVNYTVTPLASGATFTAAGEQNNFSQIGVMVKTDQPGTMFFDFSGDGVNWDSSFPTAGFAVAANIPDFHTAVKLGRYFRIRFVNDTVGDQTFLRLFTYYGNDFVPSNAPVNQSYPLDADATLVKTIPHWLQVNRGLVGGVTFINKFGKNPDASAGDTIEVGHGTMDYPATAETVDVYSSSTDDDGSPEGIGAFTVELSGIDENYALTTETVTLNGTTHVPTVNKFWFINTARVVTAATVAGALGEITIESNAVGTPHLVSITAGTNRTQTANYMVPAGCTAYFNLPQVTYINTNNNAQCEIILFKRNFGGVDELQVDWVMQAGGKGDYQPKQFGAGLKFEEKSIIYWFIKSVGTGTNIVTTDYDIWLIEE